VKVVAEMNTGKLVRDRIPEIIRESGGVPSVAVLRGDALLQALFDKLYEEADELRAADAENRVEELADVLEVLQAIADNLGLEMSELVEIADAKKLLRGGFEHGFFLLGR